MGNQTEIQTEKRKGHTVLNVQEKLKLNTERQNNRKRNKEVFIFHTSTVTDMFLPAVEQH